MTIFQQPIAEMVWDLKYRYKQGSQIIDQSVEDTWRRVAKTIAQAEKPAVRQQWEGQFNHILQDFLFLPGGRILAGAGTEHAVTLFNCFVMNIAEDSLNGIFDALEEAALTLQQGGGIGYDFSVLRPEGDLAQKTGIPSSGPVSFMQIWDTTCGILLSTGLRRGAMMGVLRCDHPDIEKFIEAKKDPRLLRHFNVSVFVTDAFMEAVKKDKEWNLIFKNKTYCSIKARALWDKIIRSAYDYAEPGVIFGDTINRMNNLWYGEQITATNPCGEIPLPPYGACNLGAVNLTKFIVAPFSEQAKINWGGLEETVKTATRFLDNVIDVSQYPLRVQQEQAFNTRRIGLGLTGLADAFVMLGIKYGSEKSLDLARELMRRISETTWQTSIELAQEKKVFPFYQPAYLQGEFVKSLPEYLFNALQKVGVRNSHHNTIAPTGTTSLLANNVSNGIEPIFHAEYTRRMRVANNELLEFQVRDYAYQGWSAENKGLPPAWVDTSSLTPSEHLAVQGAMQQFVDNAISKTINIPQDFPFEKLSEVYTRAYELGLKGCTIFRPNPITGSVLEKCEPEEDVDRCCQHE